MLIPVFFGPIYGLYRASEKNGAVYSNRPPESYVSIWVAKEALFGALSPGFSVCFVFPITLVVETLKQAIIPLGYQLLWAGLGPCHVLSWPPVAVSKSWGLLSTGTDLSFHTTVFQCFSTRLHFPIHSKVVFSFWIHVSIFQGRGFKGGRNQFAANLKCYVTLIQFHSWAYKV